MTRRMVKDIFAGTVPEHGAQDIAEQSVGSKQRVQSPAVRALGLQMEQITQNANQNAELREQLARGETVVDLDPLLIDASMIADRLMPTSDADFRQLVVSIRDNGQQVPILVRPHPEHPDRYQVAYGHRRVAAATQLQKTVKAVVRNLSDAELVVAQGKENLERRNLTFIERAMFAFHLEQYGFERKTVAAALGVGAPEASRLVTVAKSLPHDVIRTIGPAPRAGRPRWLALARLMESPGAIDTARRCLSELSLRKRQSGSDARFEAVLEALRSDGGQPEEDTERVIFDTAGSPILRIRAVANGARLTFEGPRAIELAHYVLAHMPGLVRAFGDENMCTSPAQG